MAHIQKNITKKGTGYKVYYQENGKQRTKTFPAGTPLAIVKAWAKKQDINTFQNKLYKVQPGLKPSIKLDEFQEIYLEQRKHELNLTPHKYALKALLNYFDSSTPISEIDNAKFNQFRDSLLESRLEKEKDIDFTKEQRIKRGVNKILHQCRTIWRWAIRNDYVKDNPFDKITFLKASPPPTSFLPKEKELEFYDNLPQSDIRIIYQILKFTGMRRGECLDLRERNIDLKSGFIWLEKTKNRELEYVPIHDKLKTVLQDILKGEPDRLLFTYNPDYVSRAFRKTLDKIGLEHIKNPSHMLRHTFGVRVMENNISDGNERFAQEMLRHKTPGMTRRYTKIAKRNLKEKLQNIDF